MLDDPTITYSSLFLSVVISLLFLPNNAHGQKKYQGLLWKISGNGMEKPSYLYGTMHVSSKVAFYLDQSFFDAIEGVDQVALELEPELWFDEVLGSDFMTSSYNGSGNNELYDFYENQNWNEFDNNFEIDKDLNNSIIKIYKQSPQVLNQMLFRFYDASGNFEEDTWLDMYIYQAGKKLGKQTRGLETFQLSMEMLAKSEAEIKSAPSQNNRLSYKERQEAYTAIEDAYRKGDLDRLDSLQRVVSHKSYIKWILIERNKNFVAGMDTLMRMNSMFTGVGAAHLPGKEGMIEMLRDKGFVVEPVARGKRDSKQKDKVTNLVLERPLKRFTTGDGVISFDAPWEVYTLSLEPRRSGTVSMDIANGTTFIIDRLMHYGSYTGQTQASMLSSIDSLMYELIPGKIISKKRIENNGNPGFDIINKTRKGEIHRSQLFFLPDEVIVARLSATSDKIKKGAASYYFNSLKLNAPDQTGWNRHGPSDGSLQFEAPGRAISYQENTGNRVNANMYYQVTNTNGDLYLVHRIQARDIGFLDEDHYELNKLAWAFGDDLDIKEQRRVPQTGKPGNPIQVYYEPYKGKSVQCQFRKIGLAYFAFCTITNNKEHTAQFFNSLQFNTPTYTEWFPHRDTIRYFSSSIPWDKDDKGMSLIQSNWFKEKKDPYGYVSLSTVFAPPGNTDQIKMQYERFQPYSYNDDQVDYKERLQDDLTDDGDLQMLDEMYQWNDSGCYSEHLLGDTLTDRQYKIRCWLKGRQRWTMTTVIDKTLGENEFAERFVQDLEFFVDTLAIGNFIEKPYEQFQADIISTDSTLFERANERLDQTYSFDKDARFKLYASLVKAPPALSDDEDLRSYKTRNIRIQWVDGSTTNIDRLEKEFRSFTDSATYQVEILNALIKMGNTTAMRKAKELLLWEAPIGVQINNKTGIFGSMRDTLELSGLMFPAILELTSYHEYKEPVLRLLSTMLDSGIVDKQIYKNRVHLLTQEAKVEFRRMNSSSDEADHYHFNVADDEDIAPIMMDVYWNLLYPYRNLPTTKAFFNRCANASRNHSIERYTYFLKQQGIDPSDQVCQKLMTKEEPMKSFMTLKRLGRTDLFPDSLDIEAVYARELLNKDLRIYIYGDEEDADSVIHVRTVKDSIRGRNYNTHYYKYLYKNDSGDPVWKIATIMIEQDRSGPTYPPFKALSKKGFLDLNDDSEKQLEALRRELIAANRRNNHSNSDKNQRFYFP